MAASRCCRSAGLLALGLLTALARAEPGARGELTCRLGSGDLLGASGANGLEDPPWQSLASSRRGDENRARLLLATTDVGFAPSITTSALLRIELGLGGTKASDAPSVRDVSSSLGLAWRVARSTELGLRVFPLDTNYVRLGYLHALDWGGTDVAHRDSVFVAQTGAAPGLRISFDLPRIRLFSALKWAETNDPGRGERRLWGALSGGSVELGRDLRADSGFGYFQRPATQLGSASAPGFVEGASLRVVWHRGPAEPELAEEPFLPPSLREDPLRFDAAATPGWALALEGVTLVQRQRRFERPRASALVAAPAVALYGSVRGGDWAAHAVVGWRSLGFVLRNDPRLAGDETLPASSATEAELTAWLGGSLSALPLHLVPSVEAGARLPAALRSPSPFPGFAQTAIAGGAAGFEELPVGSGRLPVVAARLGLRFQASPTLALSFFSEYQRNPNRTTFAASPRGVIRAFAKPDSLALVGAAQARF